MNMDRGVLHKSSPLVGEMGEGHGWWSVSNLRPPFEHINPSLFSSTSSSPCHSFSSLLLSNHYPIPSATTTTTLWHDNHQGQPQESWSQLLIGGLANGEESYGSSSYIYSTTTSQGSPSDEIQVPIGPSPWGSSSGHHHHTLQASYPRSSCITTTALGSNMVEFSNNNSPHECISTASGAAFKKARIQDPSPAQSTTTVKVRKEKLGDRITSLHQLVSPFGKTDTASVLLEAIGYIRFLHAQIEALSSPYVGSSSSSCEKSNSKQQHEATVQGERNCIFPEDPGQLLHDKAMKKRGQPDQDGSEAEAKKDLRSRGLCLVPVSCTVDVGTDVGTTADCWTAAPPQAFGMGFGR